MKVLHLCKHFIFSLKTLGNFLIAIFVFRLFYIALPDGLQSVISVINLPLNASPLSIRQAWGQGDAGSLLDVAITWAQGNDLDAVTQYWIVRLWSPGLPALEVIFIWLERFTSISIFYFLLIFTVFIWSFFFMTAIRLFSKHRDRNLCAALLILYTFSWDFEYFFRSGLFYTEGISLGMLGTSLLLLSRGIKEHRGVKVVGSAYRGNRRRINPLKNMVLPGSLLGLSVWVRHGIDSGLLLLLTVSMIIFLLGLYRDKSSEKVSSFGIGQNQNLKNPNRIISSNTAKKMFVFAFIGLLVTSPWRVAGAAHYQGAPLMMSSAQSLVGGGLWIDSESNPDFYWKDYGMNWACSVDPSKCIEINKDKDAYTSRELMIEAVSSSLANPLRYLEVRGEVFLQRWPGGGTALQVLLSYLVLLLPIFWFLKFQKRRLMETLPNVIIWGSFLLTLMGQLLIIHYESRYFIPIRILLIGCTISLLSQN